MSCAHLHQGDYGTPFDVQLVEPSDQPPVDPFEPVPDVPVDLTDVTLVTFVLQPPGAPAMTRPGSVQGDPTLGVVRWVPVPGDLRWFGTWLAQVVLQRPTSSSHSDAVELQVDENIGPPSSYLDARSAGIDLVSPQAAVVRS